MDDDADTLRSMRYSKQDDNEKKAILSQITLLENNIEFTLGNNIVSLEHPLTNVRIRHSLVNRKTYYKGKWTNVSLAMIITWFRCINSEEANHVEGMIFNS